MGYTGRGVAPIDEKAYRTEETDALLVLKANLDSPIFLGTPTTPTPSANDNSLKISNTEYVDAAIAALPSGVITDLGTSMTSNGYMKLSNGFIIQWGRKTCAGNSAATTIPFNVTFPAICTSIVITAETYYAGAEANSTAVRLNTSEFRLTSGSHVTSVYGWIAIGY